MPKCILIVIDSLGVGEAPDAELYGDKGSNTFGNVSKANGGLELPTFEKLGFGAITEIEIDHRGPQGLPKHGEVSE